MIDAHVGKSICSSTKVNLFDHMAFILCSKAAEEEIWSLTTEFITSDSLRAFYSRVDPPSGASVA